MRARWCVVLLIAIGCGNVSNKTPDARPDGAPCASGTVGAACTNNPGAPCLTGKLVCQSNELACVDDVAATDGTTCGAGQCTRGECIAPVSVSTTVDLSTTPLTFGRTCAESAMYNVIAIPTSMTVTTLLAPAAGCLAAGDEVLLINLQGAPSAIANVGNYEVLEVASTSDTTVTFKTPMTKYYGAAASSDAGIGVGAGDQKVALIRVAKFGELAIGSAGTLTTAPWNGLFGGVIAVRAATVTVDGSISAAGLGYRDGRWSIDVGTCSNSVTTEPGESIAGAAAAQTTNSIGGPGGIGAGAGAFSSNTPANSGAGHATAGEMGWNGGARVIGGPGSTYGSADATTLTMGSGASGNVSCNGTTSSTHLEVVGGPLAGGIIAIYANSVDVRSGTINASALLASRSVSASGGQILLVAPTLALGTNQVTAVGGSWMQTVSTTTMTIHSGNGYIVTKGSVTGTTNPAATQL